MLLDRAERAERELSFTEALAAYADAERAAPTSRLARRARARLDFLRARSEGSFVPLAELERMRRAGTSDAAALAAFEERLSAFPPGRVRREARGLLAESYLRTARLPDAVRAHRAWLDEPNLDDAEWLRASNGLAHARARLGDLAGSLETLRSRGLGASSEATYVELSLVRRWARPLAFALFGAFVLAGVFVAVTRRRLGAGLARVFAPYRLLAVAWALGVPPVLAALHRPETWRVMVLLIPGELVIVAVAALAGASLSAEDKGWRSALGVAGVVAQIAVAYFAFDASGALFGWLVSMRQG